ncbi:hypothetical protein CR205_12985 [Alteribacter lacisalsi]|uniref:Uncharacterized protein n=1 Tax=Alteribacter lacisalsi TaxID=2045244 RepID=A0A2W0HGR7_9BACI|nr:hypothetical protein [Alteribacter lacisalsi]PYZ96615.1 hypothetical protein CR205_12985 [Alteribacter lacisalsi]
MKINYRELSGYKRDSKGGLGFETYQYFYFWGPDEDLERIKGFLMDNFKTNYSEKGSNRESREMHLWSTNRHFYSVLNSKVNGEDRDKEIYLDTKKALEEEFSDLNVTVEFGKGFQLTAEKIEEFVNHYELPEDLSELETEKFSTIRYQYVGFPLLSPLTKEKMREMMDELKERLIGKRPAGTVCFTL